MKIKSEILGCCLEGVLDHHGNCERPHPTGYRGHHTSYLAHLRVHVYGVRGRGEGEREL